MRFSRMTVPVHPQAPPGVVVLQSRACTSPPRSAGPHKHAHAVKTDLGKMLHVEGLRNAARRHDFIEDTSRARKRCAKS